MGTVGVRYRAGTGGSPRQDQRESIASWLQGSCDCREIVSVRGAGNLNHVTCQTFSLKLHSGSRYGKNVGKQKAMNPFPLFTVVLLSSSCIPKFIAFSNLLLFFPFVAWCHSVFMHGS